YRHRGDLARAENNYREVLNAKRKALGDNHPEVADAIERLANVLHSRGNLLEAETLYRQSLAMQQHFHQEPSIVVAHARFLLAQLYASWGREQDAEPLWRAYLGDDYWGYSARKSLESHLTQPALVPLVVDAQNAPALWHYTFAAPPTNWLAGSFDHSGWASGAAPFGSLFYRPRSVWDLNATNIWLRREFDLPVVPTTPLVFRAKYDDEVEIFVNGVKAASGAYWTGGAYWLLPWSTEARAALHTGRNVLAVHCLNREFDACVDVGIYLAPDLRTGRLQLAGLLEQTQEYLRANVGLLAARGHLLAQSGEWKAAAVEFNKAIEMEPTNHGLYLALGPLLVQSGDGERYNGFCERVLQRFTTTNDPIVAERMAKSCLLLALPGPSQDAIAKMADAALAAGTNHWAFCYLQFCKGLSEYRQGRFENARRWMHEALTHTGEDATRDVEAYMLLAMASHRLNQFDEARAAFTKGLGVAAASLPPRSSGNLGESWHDVLIADILTQEARSLIDSGLPSAKNSP
ncbi:MAG: eukaryotic-like serine/threonine-protein kinase, partial [Acidobacteriaceae bacterium]